MYSELSEIILRYKYLIVNTFHSESYIYVSKDVRIRGYFSKPEEVRKQRSLGNTGLDSTTTTQQIL
jgi:hypothetical protein